MSKFFATQEKVVSLDDENSITIRKLSFADRLRSDDGAMSDDLAAYAMITKSIVAWSGPEFEDTPLTRENLDRLESEVLQQLSESFVELNDLGDTEKKV